MKRNRSLNFSFVTIVMYPTRNVFFTVFAILLLCSAPAHAKVNPAQYGLDAGVIQAYVNYATSKGLDSMVNTHPQLYQKQIFTAIEHPREWDNPTADFYLLLFLCLYLGLIRIIDAKYLSNLWRAFRNPTLSSRQLKEQLETSALASLMMNLFFAMAAGAYLYYVIRAFIPQRTGNIPPSLLVSMLVGGIMAIYLVKYTLIRFSGWAFKLEGVTQHYIFNVFLINKIIGIVLLPVAILLAFAAPAISNPALIASLIIVGLLLINRYTRSWHVFGSFFQYSRFHFFMYLCASELLPLAVLIKLLVRGLIY